MITKLKDFILDEIPTKEECEAKKRVPKIYYYRDNLIADNITIIDYGSYTKFLAIEEVKDELY